MQKLKICEPLKAGVFFWQKVKERNRRNRSTHPEHTELRSGRCCKKQFNYSKMQKLACFIASFQGTYSSQYSFFFSYKEAKCAKLPSSCA